MEINWRKAAKIGVSIFDQAWLSGISLLISFIFVRELEKDEFGLYVLLLNSSLFFQGIGGALLSAPYTTLYPRKQGSTQRAIVDIYAKSTIVFALAAALLACIGYLVYRVSSGDALMTLAAGAGFCICILGSVSKDNIRVLHYSQNNPTAAFRNNISYGCLLMGSIFMLLQTQMVSAAAVLTAMGISSAVVSIPRLLRPNRPDTQPSPDLQGLAAPASTRQLLGEFWSCGRWAVLGSFVTFLTSNTYPYLAAISFSKSDVADISVARILSMPIALLGAAWFNLMRPRLSQWAAEARHEKLEQTIRISVAAATALTVLEGVVLYFFGDLIRMVFGEKYANLQILTLLWTAQTGLAFIRGIYAATLMSNDLGYRDLSRIGIITLVATVIVMLVASTTPYAASIVLALTFLEVLQIALILRKRYQMQVQRCPAFN
jgi:O-antigen/teichoic acid export membrane protein